MERRVTRLRAVVVVVLAAVAVVGAQFLVPQLTPQAVAATPAPGGVTLQVKSARSVNPPALPAAGFACGHCDHQVQVADQQGRHR